MRDPGGVRFIETERRVVARGWGRGWGACVTDTVSVRDETVVVFAQYCDCTFNTTELFTGKWLRQ